MHYCKRGNQRIMEVVPVARDPNLSKLGLAALAMRALAAYKVF
jgi:hypothetical protein